MNNDGLRYRDITHGMSLKLKKQGVLTSPICCILSYVLVHKAKIPRKYLRYKPEGKKNKQRILTSKICCILSYVLAHTITNILSMLLKTTRRDW